MVDIPGLPYDGVTDVVDESGNGKGVALNVWPSDNRIPIADDPVPLDTFVLEQGELAYARTSQRLRVGDGYTPGGDEVAFTSDMDTFTQDLTDLENNLMTAMSGKANITGGNVFTGDQTFNGSVSVSGNLTVGGTFAVANISVTDQVYGVAWNNSTQVPTKNAVYDKIQSLATADISGLDTALASKAPLVHTHVIADVTNLQTTLNGKAPLVHTHVIADVTNLQTTLDAKAPLVHTHVIADVTNLQASLDAKASLALVSTSAAGLAPTRPGGTTAFLRADGAWAAPSFPGGGVTTFPLTINSDGGAAASPATFDGSVARTISYNTVGAAPLNHTHAIANVTGLQAALDSKAASVHTHVITDVTGLQAALDAKATVVQLGNYLPLAGGIITGNLQAKSGAQLAVFGSNGTARITHSATVSAFYSEAYDTGDSLHKPWYLRASDLVIEISGAQRAQFSSTGLAVTGTITASGKVTGTGGLQTGNDFITRSDGQPLFRSVSSETYFYAVGIGNYRWTNSGNSVQTMILDNVGNLTVTGTVTANGSVLATVSQLANYLPLTGGTLSGALTVTGNLTATGANHVLGKSIGAAADCYLDLRCTNVYNIIHFKSYAVDGTGASTDARLVSYRPGQLWADCLNTFKVKIAFNDILVVDSNGATVNGLISSQGTSAGINLAARDFGNNFIISVNTSGILTFYSAAAPRATLSDAGDLTITGQFYGTVANFQTPNAGTTGGIRLKGNATTGNALLQVIDSTGAAQWSYLHWQADGSLHHTGAFSAAGNISSLSDRRVKSNIRGLTSGLRIVNALRGVRFIKDDKPDIGVIAQEVQKLVPEVVTEGADGMLSVDYGRLTAVLIEAVKELTNRVQKLEAAR